MESENDTQVTVVPKVRERTRYCFTEEELHTPIAMPHESADWTQWYIWSFLESDRREALADRKEAQARQEAGAEKTQSEPAPDLKTTHCTEKEKATERQEGDDE